MYQHSILNNPLLLTTLDLRKYTYLRFIYLKGTNIAKNLLIIAVLKNHLSVLGNGNHVGNCRGNCFHYKYGNNIGNNNRGL